MKRSFKLVIAAAAVGAFIGALAATGGGVLVTGARAATSCGSALHYFDGTDPTTANGSVYAISANANTYTPALCGASDSDSSAWTMLGDSGSGQGYAQSGYGRHAGQSTVYYFAEYRRCNTCSVVHKETSAASGTNSYTQFYDFNAGVIDMEVNGSVILTTNFDPILYWSAPWLPEWEGEALYYGDDVPGISSSLVYFSSMQIVKCRSCSWVTPSSLTVSSTSSRYGVGWDTANTKFHIWTK